jgi:alkylation response protein AidB-like acyl-CoA dehydrogenase
MDLRLTEEQLMIRQTVRDFAQSEVKPVSRELDAKVDPRDCFSWDLVKKAGKLGLRTLALPAEYGGGGIRELLTHMIVIEELAAADLGFASIFRSQTSLCSMITGRLNKALKDEFVPKIIEDEEFLLAICHVEPNHGTDAVLCYDAPETIETFAEKKSNEYIINGVKHFTSNGGVAKLYFINARTRRGVPISQGMSLFLVPHDRPGFSIGHIHNKLGRRLLSNAEEIFEDVHIPARYFVGETEDNEWQNMQKAPLTLLHCCGHLGTLRTCYEESLDYAKTRVQGGKPIIGHHTVAAKLGSMKVKIDALRTILWWTATCWDNKQDYDPRMDWLIKGFTDEVAIDVIHKMMDIFGGMSTDKEMPVEKYIRDLCTALHGMNTAEMNYIKGGLAL